MNVENNKKPKMKKRKLNKVEKNEVSKSIKSLEDTKKAFEFDYKILKLPDYLNMHLVHVTNDYRAKLRSTKMKMDNLKTQIVFLKDKLVNGISEPKK